MALSKEFMQVTQGILSREHLQACALHSRLSERFWSVSWDTDKDLFTRLFRICMKAHKRCQRRYAAFVAFREIRERELKALENIQSESKLIPGWQHSNINTLPGALISVTQTGQSIRFPVGGLYSEINYKRKRIPNLGRYLYTKSSPLLSKRYFPLPIKYQLQIIPG